MYVLHVGDVRRVLRQMPEESVQCVVTSPPYWGLRDYEVDGQIGREATPEEYTRVLTEVFQEVRRVLTQDGTLWLNLGDSYKEKSLVGIPWRVAFALQADGWCLRQDIIWAKPNPMPESVTDRCTRSHEYLFMLVKSERYCYNKEMAREPAVGVTPHDLTGCGTNAPGQTKQKGNRGRAPSGKYYYNQQAVMEPSVCPRTRGPAKHACKDTNGNAGLGRRRPTATRNMRDVWTIPTQSYKGAHFAVFPEALVEPCVLAGSREGDIVMDPFAGSGTVGAVSKRLGRLWVGVELNKEYAELVRGRVGEDLEVVYE